MGHDLHCGTAGTMDLPGRIFPLPVALKMISFISKVG